MWPFGSSKKDESKPAPAAAHNDAAKNKICDDALREALQSFEADSGTGAKAFQVANMANDAAKTHGVSCNITSQNVMDKKGGRA